MKKTVQKIAVAVLAVVIFSALTMTAFAANIVGQTFSCQLTFGTYVKLQNHEYKSDTSPMYLDLDQNFQTTSFYVRAIGYDPYSGREENVTYYDGQIVDHVHCFANRIYGVKNLVLERGFDRATFSFLPCGSSTTVTGLWAADSAQEHNIATP